MGLKRKSLGEQVILQIGNGNLASVAKLRSQRLMLHISIGGWISVRGVICSRCNRRRFVPKTNNKKRKKKQNQEHAYKYTKM